MSPSVAVGEVVCEITPDVPVDSSTSGTYGVWHRSPQHFMIGSSVRRQLTCIKVLLCSWRTLERGASGRPRQARAGYVNHSFLGRWILPARSA
jgi:hypothetical protein